MLKFVWAVAIAAILSLQPAAAQLGGAHQITETSDKAEQNKNFNVISFVVEQVQISFSIIMVPLHYAQDEGEERITSTKRDCIAAAEEGAEGADAKDQEPVGPEPLYFGF